MFIERNDNLLDIGLKLDLNNYLEVMVSKYPSYYPNKESVKDKRDNGKDRRIS